MIKGTETGTHMNALLSGDYFPRNLHSYSSSQFRLYSI